jgi:hypothetical protein
MYVGDEDAAVSQRLHVMYGHVFTFFFHFHLRGILKVKH